MSRMFGTDGVRGVANEKLSSHLALDIGIAGTCVLAKEKTHPTIIVGSDTRKSKDMLRLSLSSGICAAGGNVIDVGVIPTPALPFLTRKYNADAAVMISASHNPMQDNGIKWFDKNGYKLSDTMEDEIEALIKGGLNITYPTGAEIGTYEINNTAKQEYIDFLCASCDVALHGIHIALDCANGASSEFAPTVFERLGAKVSVCDNHPNGCNINAGCGSTHIDNLKKFIKETGADVGFAFDGDADRLIAADENAEEVNGDTIMGILALDMHNTGKLKKDTLVITVMSNLGLKQKMRQSGIKTVETKVGDKHVLEMIRKEGYNIGGEQSGHIILFDYNTSGDGMLSAIRLISTVVRSDEKLSSLAKQIPILPQYLLNVQVDSTAVDSAKSDPEMKRRADEVNTYLGERGRVLVRPSGTEPLIRIMLEGTDTEEIKEKAMYIAEPLILNYNGICRK